VPTIHQTYLLYTHTISAIISFILEVVDIPEGASAAPTSTHPRSLKPSNGSRPSHPLTSVPDTGRNGHPSAGLQAQAKRPREASTADAPRVHKLHKSASEPVMNSRGDAQQSSRPRPVPPSQPPSRPDPKRVLPLVAKGQGVEIAGPRVSGSANTAPATVGSTTRTVLGSVAEAGPVLPDLATPSLANGNGNGHDAVPLIELVGDYVDPRALSIVVPEAVKTEPPSGAGSSFAGSAGLVVENGVGKTKPSGPQSLSSGRCARSPPSVDRLDTPSPLTPRLSPKLAF
jgi:hypothetical protein